MSLFQIYVVRSNLNFLPVCEYKIMVCYRAITKHYLVKTKKNVVQYKKIWNNDIFFVLPRYEKSRNNKNLVKTKKNLRKTKNVVKNMSCVCNIKIFWFHEIRKLSEQKQNLRKTKKCRENKKKCRENKSPKKMYCVTSIAP